MNDQGNTGSGGALSDTKSVLITRQRRLMIAVGNVDSADERRDVHCPGDHHASGQRSDVDGQVVKVEFFPGTNLLGGALTNPPYQFIWSNVPAGVYSLYASATDNLGATNISSLVTITNKQPGFVKLESPQGGGGSFSMLITGEAGQVYNVQTSSNLTDWTTEATVTNITGTVPYSTNIPPGTTQLYYRAKVAE